MSDNGKHNISETFGKYTEAASDASRNNVNGPRNVTSDMWTPISTGRAAELKTDNRASGEKREQTDEGIITQKDNKKAGEKNNKSPVKGDKQSPKGSKERAPKGKPVKDVIRKKLQQDNIKRSVAQQKKQKQQRHRQELDKDRADYENQRNEGKSHNEISKKRAELKRKKRIIRNALTVVVFFVFVIAFVGIYIYAKGAPVATVIIEGDSIYSNTEISSAAGVSTGVNMFSLREKTINDSVTATLPYIHSVEIDRDLPDTFIIKVTPTTEKFLIVNGTEYICVDEHMKILSLKKKKLKDGFFRIYGLEQQSVQVGTEYLPSKKNKEKFELVTNIVAEFEKNGVIKSAVINVNDMNDVKVLYNSKIMLYLGSCPQLENQINLACNVIKDTVSQGQTGYIDMRYSNMAFFNEGTINAD